MKATKEHTRDSVLTHLSGFQLMGLEHLLPPPCDHSSQPPAQRVVLPPPQNTGTVAITDTQTLPELQAHIGDCTRCRLCEKRTNLVFGVGNPNADLMFIGEGPGADEDLQGEPFVGRAGKLLTKIINSMGFERSEIYIANVVKCRPPQNRNPEPDEIEQCMPFLMQQIRIVKPKVIMCLGKFAAQTVLNTKLPISKIRGEFRDYQDTLIMPSFHPAYLLRNPSMKRVMWEDCKKVMAKLKEL